MHIHILPRVTKSKREGLRPCCVDRCVSYPKFTSPSETGLLHLGTWSESPLAQALASKPILTSWVLHSDWSGTGSGPRGPMRVKQRTQVGLLSTRGTRGTVPGAVGSLCSASRESLPRLEPKESRAKMATYRQDSFAPLTPVRTLDLSRL